MIAFSLIIQTMARKTILTDRSDNIKVDYEMFCTTVAFII